MLLIISRVIVGFAFIGCMTVSGPVQATLFMALVGFSTDLGIGAVWAYAQDVGGRNCGAVMGWANMWGNLGAALSPIIMGAILGLITSSIEFGWQLAFIFCAIIQLLAVFASFGVTADKKMINWTELGSWASWRREVFVAIRCQAVGNVNYCVHRLATVASQLAN